ncbi:STAS domain-containing protein [Nonomuraea sp. NPDC050663]|uniref:STAS domain-containing protein n=1 Tax=Nonomuraea sp. NPDC050663 TaxID=3364370 RepID=UPI003791BC3A
MRVSVDLVEPFAVAAVAGEVDSTTTGRLQAAIDEAVKLSPHLLLDLSEMGFLDSAGIRVILHAFNHARETGGSLAMCSLRPSPQRLIELVGLAEYIPIYRTRDDAMEIGPVLPV